MTSTATDTHTEDTSSESTALLRVEDLKVHIPIRLGMLRRGLVRAVDGVSFELERGRTLGLVGESGCGKTTTAKATMRLERVTSGRILLKGQDITTVKGEELRRVRKHMQIVFQDPYSALNPRLTVTQIIGEPLRAQGMKTAAIEKRVLELLDLVGLAERYRYSFPHQFSGGQRQRIGTARALATNPDVLILDEPVSALDVSVQAQVVNLFTDLQSEFDIGMIFISHDLSVVRHISDDVAVMYLGQIVEQGNAEQVLDHPAHPYTQALISAAPGSPAGGERIVLTGDVPSPVNPPTGCRFRSRCWKATEVCTQAPPLVPLNESVKIAEKTETVEDADALGQDTTLQAADAAARGAHLVACWHPES